MPFGQFWWLEQWYFKSKPNRVPFPPPQPGIWVGDIFSPNLTDPSRKAPVVINFRWLFFIYFKAFEEKQAVVTAILPDEGRSLRFKLKRKEKEQKTSPKAYLPLPSCDWNQPIEIGSHGILSPITTHFFLFFVFFVCAFPRWSFISILAAFANGCLTSFNSGCPGGRALVHYLVRPLLELIFLHNYK